MMPTRLVSLQTNYWPRNDPEEGRLGNFLVASLQWHIKIKVAL